MYESLRHRPRSLAYLPASLAVLGLLAGLAETAGMARAQSPASPPLGAQESRVPPPRKFGSLHTASPPGRQVPGSISIRFALEFEFALALRHHRHTSNLTAGPLSCPRIAGWCRKAPAPRCSQTDVSRGFVADAGFWVDRSGGFQSGSVSLLAIPHGSKRSVRPNY